MGIVQACHLALERNLQLAAQQQQVRYSQGALLVNQAAFEPVLSGGVNAARKRNPLPGEVQQAYGLPYLQNNTATLDVGLSKLLRSGIRIAPSLQLNRASDNQAQPTGLNTGQIGLQIVFPLARNRVDPLSTLREQAAMLDEQAAIQDLRYRVAQVLDATAAAYWQYLGALHTLQAYQDAERRAADMLDNVKALASIDLIPRVQVQDALSNLSARAMVRLGQERSAVQARQALAQAIGQDEAALAQDMALADPLPEHSPESAQSVGGDAAPAAAQYVALGLGNRADLRAAQIRVAQQETLLQGFRGQLRPQLDLAVGVGYAGARLGNGVDRFGNPWAVPAGPSVSMGLQYQFPQQNLEAQGFVLQTEATLRQNESQAIYVRRQIASDVIVGLQNLKTATSQLEEAGRGVAAAQASQAGARERLRRGIGSVLDTLQTEDRYLSAIVGRIGAQVALATAISSLRLATGTYVNPDLPQQDLRREMFYTPLTSWEPPR